QLASLLQKIEQVAKHVAQLRERSVAEQNKLEEIGKRGRDGRQRLGYAVDGLGADTSKAREELRAAQENVAFSHKQTLAAKKRFAESHREITMWEGRSGFAEPYEDLANAYRDAAEVVDGWIVAREMERRAEGSIEGLSQAVRDLEFQLTQLRESLVTHELDIEAEREACEQLVLQMTQEIDEAEEELLSMATALCEPLRKLPELGPLFQRLEAA
ncbi:MAG TPA: hypothetical protein VF316_01090, partial [Polyangiaceae bacterium]